MAFFYTQNQKGALIVVAIVFLIMALASSISSCSNMFLSGLSARIEVKRVWKRVDFGHFLKHKNGVQ